MNINRKNIGRRIKKIRVIDLDMNQKRFAKKLGVTQPMVSKYEKGETIPSAQILLKIAKLGRTTVEMILEGGGRGAGSKKRAILKKGRSKGKIDFHKIQW